jgi:hypothetical protein
LTTPNIALQRLHAQRIAHSEFQDPGEVVSWLGALQAQDYASGEWTIGVRLPDATQATIERAIADKTIVRTWALRGTLHIVNSADVKWLLTLVAPTLLARFASFHRQLELDEVTMAKSYEVITKTLQDGMQLTRKELIAALEDAGIQMAGQRGANLINRAGYEGLICLGPRRGKQETYTLLDEWLPQAKTMARDDALAELALRYFTSHGPATVHDFAWWTGLSVTDAKAGVEAVKSQLAHETIAQESKKGRTYWRAPSTSPAPTNSSSAYLLPGFDEYILGYTDRSGVLDVAHLKTIMPSNGIFPYTMILDGRVVGTWKRTFRYGSVVITFSPFAPLPAVTTPAFAAAAYRYAEFLGLPLLLLGEE